MTSACVISKQVWNAHSVINIFPQHKNLLYLHTRVHAHFGRRGIRFSFFDVCFLLFFFFWQKEVVWYMSTTARQRILCGFRRESPFTAFKQQYSITACVESFAREKDVCRRKNWWWSPVQRRCVTSVSERQLSSSRYAGCASSTSRKMVGCLLFL